MVRSISIEHASDKAKPYYSAHVEFEDHDLYYDHHELSEILAWVRQVVSVEEARAKRRSDPYHGRFAERTWPD